VRENQPMGSTSVAGSRFDATAKRLDIDSAFDKHAQFPCPACGAADCPVYDARPLTWRHLNFWQHQTSLTARVPRVRCEACGVKTVSVPWSRDDRPKLLLNPWARCPAALPLLASRVPQ
jgi:transposase